jgi:hypothetical protein
MLHILWYKHKSTCCVTLIYTVIHWYWRVILIDAVICWYVSSFIDRCCDMLICGMLYWQTLWYADTCCVILIDTVVCWYVMCYKCYVVLTDRVIYWYVLCAINRYCDIQDICYAILNMLWYKNAYCVILTRDVLYWKYCDVRIKKFPPGAWRFVCCECCMLSGRSLCDGLITRREKSYRLWRVVVCDHETSYARRL